MASSNAVWSGLVIPLSGPFAGGVFKFLVSFPRNYPVEHPSIFFLTKVGMCFDGPASYFSANNIRINVGFQSGSHLPHHPIVPPTTPQMFHPLVHPVNGLLDLRPEVSSLLL